MPVVLSREYYSRIIENSENLNLNNFWNPLKEKYPFAVFEFCSWIDQYKRRVDWGTLFNGTFGLTTPKFHDIPLEMQIGILLKFLDSPYMGNRNPRIVSQILNGDDIIESMADLIGAIVEGFETRNTE